MSDDTQILNLSNAKTKAMLIGWIKSLDGIHRVTIRKAKRGKTLPQLGYLFGVVYPCVQRGLDEAWGERKSVAWVHGYMKSMFLSEPVVNQHTGEEMPAAVGSVGDLSVGDMCQYIDSIIKFAAEDLGVEIPAAGEYESDTEAA